MPEWVLVALAVLAVPLAAIIGGIAVVGFAIWVGHRNRMTKLQIEEKERQAEMDRDLLGLGSRDISAHMETVLDRMNAVETRLDKVEAMANIEAAKARGRAAVTGAEEQPSVRQRDDQTEVA